MAGKRGQIALFILIGLIFLIVLFSLFYVMNQKRGEESRGQEVSLEAQPVKEFIDSCLKKVSEDGIYFIGKQGGYYNTPEPFIEYSQLKVPFYYQFGEQNVPGIYIVQKELSSYVADSLPACLNNFESFREMGYDIKAGRIKADSTITEDSILVDADFPVEVSKESSIERINSFSSRISFDFMEKYRIAGMIADEQQKSGDYTPLGFMDRLAYENDFSYRIINFAEPSIVVDLIFNESGMEEPFVYSFAMNYYWSDIE